MRDPILIVQDLLPQSWLARVFGRLARSRQVLLRRILIWLWMRIFKVTLDDARRRDPRDYRSFEDFFTRELREGARPAPENPRSIISPADGFLRQFGGVTDGQLIQAKGIDYSLSALLADEGFASELRDGWFATIYLSPADYHRVHAPCDSRLIACAEIPGTGYSVTNRTESILPDLYCRNARLVCYFDTRVGPMALVMVGAFLVTGIETIWRARQPMDELRTTAHSLTVHRGDEIGRFTLGSTVIVVLPRVAIEPDPALCKNRRIRVGNALGLLRGS